MTDPIDTPLGQRLAAREREAEGQWIEALAVAADQGLVRVLDQQAFLNRIARPLTWRLWEMAIQEA